MRLALGLSYLGQAYEGWQSQRSGQTVQDKLEEALSAFCQQKVQTVCAGRTDSGVHGLMQVVHLDTDLQRDMSSWVRGTNAFLPADIAIQWAKEVPPNFHARASATGRRYLYMVLSSPVRPSLESGRVGWVFRPLHAPAMQSAAQWLLGEHDFSSFRASACQSPSPIKTLRKIDICPCAGNDGHGYWRFEFEANAFLHHMIRNIMGCLLQIGQGLQNPSWMHAVLMARNRDVAAPTFSPDGLYFLGPQYGTEWGLPPNTPALDWLPCIHRP
ncbi:MAG: tRNA pseudouridine(38-40) synthase TruA [Betaproteobacteria bacterium]|nr:tRNA pseudouridine(38-40) synthase TruA [Betaproteobacteria bacterium]NBY05439.1 tRNA pseudouridine(38-40) synthase TruA [Betaproteobacteria bacterium]